MLKKFFKLIKILRKRFELNKIKVKSSLFAFIDETSIFGGYNNINRGTSIRQSKIGYATYVSVETIIGKTEIGNYCSIGARCMIGGLGHHPTKWLTTHPAFFSVRGQIGFTYALENLFDEIKNTFIGSDVWIGAGVIILDGVSIGSGAIIGAGAVVVSDIPPFSIVVGVPGKVIRKRFSDEVIAELLDWQWWNLDNFTLSKISGQFVDTKDWTLQKIQMMKENIK